MNTPIEQPELPAAYNLIMPGKVANLREYTVHRASEGAEEGTIILAEDQEVAFGCAGKSWQCFPENLHCSLVLQPDFSKERYHEIVFVALVSLGNSLATHVSPMTALGYSWPNDINIAQHKIAAIWLDQGDCPHGPWLSITCSVNIRHAPKDLVVEAMSIHEAEGGTTLSSAVLMETFARQFITLINAWSERGFDYILALWKIRAEFQGTKINLELNGNPETAEAKDVTKNGDLVVTDSAGRRQIITTGQHMGW